MKLAGLPDQPAIQASKGTLTYASLQREIDRWADLFGQLALPPGTGIALLASNQPVFLIFMLAALKRGIPFIPLDPHLKPGEIQSLLDFSEPAYFFASSGYAPLYPDAAVTAIEGTEPPTPSRCVPYSNAPWGYAAECAVVQFSSGSTGRPKGILVSQRALRARVDSLVHALKLTSRDRTLCSVPLSHSHGMDCLALPTLVAGGELILMEPSSSTPPAVWEMIRSRQVTFFSSIPQFYEMSLKLSRAGAIDAGSLRLPFCGSAALAASTAQNFFERFGVHIRQGYGLAEIGVITLNQHEDLRADEAPAYESIGKPLPGIEARVDESGQLIVRSEALFSGYLKDPEQTQTRLVDGELLTQDVVQKDERGRYFIVGRMNESIHTLGHKIFPLEVEREVADYPEVKNCALVGKKDLARGEVAILHLELTDLGLSHDPAELRREVIRRLRVRCAEYKIPSQVVIHEVLPKSPLGKVLRSKLREG